MLCHPLTISHHNRHNRHRAEDGKETTDMQDARNVDPLMHT